MDTKISEITAEQTHDLRHRVMWPDQPISFAILPEDANGIHFGLWKNEVLISIVSVFLNEKEAQFRKFATETTEQGHGYGSQLLHHLIDFVKSKGVQLLWCNARSEKAYFYEKFGFKTTDETYTKKGIDFVKMQMTI
jgi:predicted GNAT family N-acyltransferase